LTHLHIYVIMVYIVNLGKGMIKTRTIIQEPEVKGISLDQTTLSAALNWYNQNKDSKDSQKYASDYLKKKHKISADSVLKYRGTTFGYVCRILTNGGILSDKDQSWFDSELESLKSDLSKVKEEVPVEKTNVINIQDRIREKAKEYIGEMEGQIDDLIISNFSSNVSPYGIMHTMEVKGAYTKFIVDHFKTRRAEFDEVLNTKDNELKEAYSNFTKPNLKKLIAYCDQVILDCGKLSSTAVKSRKPRKRKVKSATELTAKMNYCKEFAELKLTSIKPTDIIGTLQLWVYNTKTKKLGVYNAEDAGGLSVKGSSIQNFSETKSVQKTLRKPAVTLPEVLKGGKVVLRNILTDIRAVESALTGRINNDTILLRSVK